MSQPTLRNVYFWSKATGLMEFPQCEFQANANRQWVDMETRLGEFARKPTFSEARPFLRYTTEHPPNSATIKAAFGAIGLLWTTGTNPHRPFPDMIPVVLESIQADPQSDIAPRVIWDIEVAWRSLGSFVADGFTEPQLCSPN